MSEVPEEVLSKAKEAIQEIKSTESFHSNVQIGNCTRSKFENTQCIGVHKSCGVHHKTLKSSQEESDCGATMVLVGNYVQGAVHVVIYVGVCLAAATFIIMFSTKAECMKGHGVEATSYGDAPDDVKNCVAESVEQEGSIHTLFPNDSIAVIGQGITVTETAQESLSADITSALAGGGGSVRGALIPVKSYNFKTCATGAEFLGVVRSCVLSDVGYAAKSFSVNITVDGIVASEFGDKAPFHSQQNSDDATIADDDESAVRPSDTAENYKTAAENLGSSIAVVVKYSLVEGKCAALTSLGGNTDATITSLAAQNGSTQCGCTPIASASSFDCLGTSACAVNATVEQNGNATKSEYNQPASINCQVVAESCAITEVHGESYKVQTAGVSDVVGPKLETAQILSQGPSQESRDRRGVGSLLFLLRFVFLLLVFLFVVYSCNIIARLW